MRDHLRRLFSCTWIVLSAVDRRPIQISAEKHLVCMLRVTTLSTPHASTIHSILNHYCAMTAVCVACRRPILDRYVLEAVPGLLQWHTACLRCTQCGQLIDETSRTCFIRRHSVYCSHDYHRSVWWTVIKLSRFSLIFGWALFSSILKRILFV